MSVRHIKFFLLIFVFVFSQAFFAVVNAAYERFATGETAVIGEFVYDDNFVATTTAGCTLSVYDPTGSLIVNAASMTANANGFTHYSFSVPASGPEGVWPTAMTCGNVLNGDLVKLDKSFVVGATLVSTSTLATSVWTSASRSLTTFGTLVSDVWANGTRTLTSGGGASAADVWSYATRRLTDGALDSGSLALTSDVTTASSSLAAVINGIPSVSGWRTSLNNSASVQAGSGYRARLFVANNSGVPVAPNATPTITIYDSNRSLIVSNAAMTNISTGQYEYTYSVASGAAQGTWESIVATDVDGSNTVTNNSYWLVAGSPAQVIINSVTTDSGVANNNVSANLTVTNEGLTGYEYQYEWCVVSSVDNSCGGGDDEYRGTGAKFINPGEDWNTDLTATITESGSYYFKVVVYFGTERSGSSRTFDITVLGDDGDTGNSGSGGGGGGSNPQRTAPGPVPATVACGGSSFDCNGRVDSVDFSILLYFWKATPPFANPNVDINKDGKVDSIDFSIMLYNWTR